jgi:hypothetical protein
MTVVMSESEIALFSAMKANKSSACLIKDPWRDLPKSIPMILLPIIQAIKSLAKFSKS